ncbi:hypothetical protein [Pseudomonas sp. LS-2]|uniref:hypothetical protein n=1 Tax=Pseudomonas sp. LS-2 TaxID=2315859 RepID=UPI000E750483|nr:hypothetical protein [Pseudomonas sp. LS-2]RJX72596.1 hypothetical protein D3M70_30805 [Pseudomonas sp. LS-2]
MTNTLSFDLDELAHMLEELARVDAAMYTAITNGDPIEEYARQQVSLARARLFAKILSAAKHDPAAPQSLRDAIEGRDQAMARHIANREELREHLAQELGLD